jgi:predicted ArsR family transcriptional regulator
VVSPWSRLALLVDGVRRGLYEYVLAQQRAVTREEAAAALGCSRGLAAFHLDKLVEAGLLAARYQSPPGPRGRGRAPKAYLATAETVEVSVPQRRYELAGQILADAIVDPSADTRDAALRCARASGTDLGVHLRTHVNAADDDLDRATDALAGLGYHPCLSASDRLRLANCPFHALAERQPELICAVNREFVDGLLTGLGADGLQAHLAPEPGACCVAVTRTPAP